MNTPLSELVWQLTLALEVSFSFYAKQIPISG
jgi:hypothetical protein